MSKRRIKKEGGSEINNKNDLHVQQWIRIVYFRDK